MIIEPLKAKALETLAMAPGTFLSLTTNSTTLLPGDLTLQKISLTCLLFIHFNSFQEFILFMLIKKMTRAVHPE
ncbi:MAG: hypothetical protein B9J98_04045 [Candidatus Terraquivivens tikiterensis]|uniref:Uncharacterized protein n=1 Tax=Candidatus Terraquivivens tikiterensis TaxID=1980982 RepID=A0A2R7Y509_9ARCH|nr:MAG: hypothetical protein B9J98_04045 [Candidatus Terraquivivens tikiterensis]